MKKIGLISDTHGFLHPRVKHHFADCDEIWHAGDVGTEKILDELSTMAPLRAVYGNIDGTEIRKRCPKDQLFILEDVKVWMTHIGSYPPRYNSHIRPLIMKQRPDLFICGHSHILKAIPDKSLNLLHLNPGAAGKQGFHQLMTLMRFNLAEGKVKDLEVIELQKRA
jgi:putative phosphoesterase